MKTKYTSKQMEMIKALNLVCYVESNGECASGKECNKCEFEEVRKVFRCEGIENPNDLRKQRDALLGACKKMFTELHAVHKGKGHTAGMIIASEAIKKAEGK